MTVIQREIHPAILLASSLFSIDSEQLPMLQCSLALCAWHEERGDSIVPLKLYAEQLIEVVAGSQSITWQAPSCTEWSQQLLQLDLVNKDQAPNALMITEQSMSWHRLFRHEQALVQLLLGKAQKPIAQLTTQQIEIVHQLFQFKPTQENIDWQLLAATHCLCHDLSIITGGPGTGKTSTISKVIGMLQHFDADTQICLAAPTGKAAARMLEAINESAKDVAQALNIEIAFPEQAYTLHRLRNALRSQQIQNINCLIIDEVSMADVSTLNSCLQLLPQDCRIILLGDPMQLSSVESGSVLIDLCAVSPEIFSDAFGKQLQQYCGYNLETGPKHGLAGYRVALKTNWRFKDAPGITALSSSILAGEQELQAICQNHSDCTFHQIQDHALADLIEGCLPHFTQIRLLDSPTNALQHLRQLAILCAWKNGPWSVQQCNATFDRALRQAWGVTQRTDWYHGKPFMILRNNYDLEVYNGDVGVIWDDMAWIDSGDKIQSIPIHDLHDAEALFACSIHKSQGSQFQDVHVLLPQLHIEHLNRALYYTGVTRAKQSVHIWSTDQTLKHCCSQEIQRHTGLRAQLLRESPY